MLNPESPIPLYHQLADILTDQIRTGRYAPGDRVPSETGIAKDYKIGRPTVRQAMDTLVRKGLIQRKRGSGTFVKEQAPDVDIFSLAGTSQAFLTKGIKIRTQIIRPVAVRQIQEDSNNPFHGKEAYCFSRLTLVDNKPILLEEICLHSQLFNGLEKLDLENRSLSAVVADQYYLRPEKGHQTFVLSFLPREKAKFLGLGTADQILEVQRKLDFPGNEQAVFSRIFCRTDKFAFSQTITRPNGDR